MAECIDSNVEYEIRNGDSPIEERQCLLGQNANIRIRQISGTEMESSQLSQEHMPPAEREEEEHSSSTSEILLHREANVKTHCHGPATSEDPVARNQLIAISVLCFVFMVAEVVGERCF